MCAFNIQIRRRTVKFSKIIITHKLARCVNDSADYTLRDKIDRRHRLSCESRADRET